VVPLGELYAACIARARCVRRTTCRAYRAAVRRARGAYARTPQPPRLLDRAPPAIRCLDAHRAAVIRARGVGKVDDLFARPRDRRRATRASNAEGLTAITAWLPPDRGGCASPTW
jgi:hypothetical protein